MQFKGKQRLILIAVVAAVLVGGLAMVNARGAKPERPAPTPESSNVNGQTTATQDEVQRLKSWGLTAAELPSGTHLRFGEEFRNYAAAQGNKQAEIKIAETGRIDGFYQDWEQSTAQMHFQVFFDLYNSPASAMAVLAEQMKADATKPIENLPDPKLGDSSRMYTYTTAPQGGPKLEGWVVQWVRGRTVLYIGAQAPAGEIRQDDILNTARRIDSRAQAAPVK